MSTLIQTARERVWRALTEPAEVIRWDGRIVALAEPAPDYPKEGVSAHWRCRLGSIAVDLHDRPLEVVPGRRLRSAVELGLFRFEETWDLASEAGESDQTRLGLRLATRSFVPVVGGLFDRFDVRNLASQIVDGNLRAIRKWCEADHDEEPLLASTR